MADYTVDQLKGALAGAGFSGQALDVATAISLAENSGLSLDAVNTAGNSPAGSRDRGPFQINDYWHADVPDSCAFDLTCAANAFFKISGGGQDFSAWTTYKKGTYLSHLADATAAAIGGGAPTATLANIGPIPTPSDAVNAVVDALGHSLKGAVFVLGGIGLVVAGLWAAVAPVRKRVNDAEAQAAPAALTVAAMA